MGKINLSHLLGEIHLYNLSKSVVYICCIL